MITAFVHLFVCFSNVIHFIHRIAANGMGNLLESDQNIGIFLVRNLIKFDILCSNKCYRSHKSLPAYKIQSHSIDTFCVFINLCKNEIKLRSRLRYNAISLTMTLAVVDMQYSNKNALQMNKSIEFQ